MTIIYLYFILINIYGYMLMKIDKKRAIHHQYRVSEKKLWAVAFLFGAIGLFAGMKSFRRKTKHTSFKYGLPVMSLVEFGFVLYFMIVLS